MTEREALKLALEALDLAIAANTFDLERIHAAIIAVKEALAQSEQEPVAHVSSVQSGSPLMCGLSEWERQGLVSLYTTPPQRTWVGLTDEQKLALCKQFPDHLTFNAIHAIEAKLKEKNT